MEQIFKTGITLFCLVLFILLGLGMISASIDSNAAEQFTADAAKQIEEYNYSDNIITACKQNAQSRGYNMDVHPFDTNGDGRNDMAEIITHYNFKLSFKADADAKIHSVRVYAR